MTDANSSFTGGAQLQPSRSMNTDSFMRVPASPISFSSNNISGTSVIDGSIVQQSPPQDQVQKRRSSSVTSHPMIEAGGVLHAPKKSRIDVRQDELQQQLIQQLLHGQSSLHLQGQQNPQLQALIQQHELAQLQQRQQQLLQPFAQIQPSQIGISRQPQLRPPLAQPGIAGPIRTPVDTGLCSRRLMQYLYHKRHRPENNPITYWRKLVEEYFAPRARERWCVSSYDKRANASVSTPQTTQDTWRCDICNTHGGKGYEATYEVLPRLCQIRFDHGVIDEYLFLDMPNESRLPNGLMLLEHTKVVQKSVYENQHVTHEGHLRIIFTPELKIMSWEFCSQRHEEYITRRVQAPQVNNLLQVAQKHQAATSESGHAGVSNNDAQTICSMFVTASRQLVKNLEQHTLNEHGLSKRYVRCLQISEVVNHMKDFIEFTNKNNLGPIAMAGEAPFHIFGEEVPNPFAEEVANPEAPQGHAGNGGNGGVARLNWTSVMSSRMLQKFAMLVAEGIRTDKGFKNFHCNRIAKDLSAFMGFPVVASQVQNHLRKWRAKWLNICRLKDLSGAGWDEEKCMITLDDDHYSGHLKDHPKDEEFLNVPLPNYGLMQTVFAAGVATGKFAMGSNDPLGTPPERETIDLDNMQSPGAGREAGGSSRGKEAGPSSKGKQVLQ